MARRHGSVVAFLGDGRTKDEPDRCHVDARAARAGNFERGSTARRWSVRGAVRPVAGAALAALLALAPNGPAAAAVPPPVPDPVVVRQGTGDALVAGFDGLCPVEGLEGEPDPREFTLDLFPVDTDFDEEVSLTVETEEVDRDGDDVIWSGHGADDPDDWAVIAFSGLCSATDSGVPPFVEGWVSTEEYEYEITTRPSGEIQVAELDLTPTTRH